VSPELQEEFKKLYAKITPAKIQKENILILVHQIVPKAGFMRGCVYVFEPDSITLVPRLKIGSAELSDFKTNPL